MLGRYARNLQALSEREVALLSERTVAVVGCGGLGGGYLLEYLGRLGVGSLVAVDGDRFEESNLNRQLLSDTTNLKAEKATVAAARMALVNPSVAFRAIIRRVDLENGVELFLSADLVLDATDGIGSRLALQEIAEGLGIPLVHGAVAGWYGQVASIFPGDRTMNRIYGGSLDPNGRNRGVEERLGNLSFGPAAIAAVQAAEAVKILIGRGALLRWKLLVVDFLENETEIVDFGPETAGETQGGERA